MLKLTEADDMWAHNLIINANIFFACLGYILDKSLPYLMATTPIVDLWANFKDFRITSCDLDT